MQREAESGEIRVSNGVKYHYSEDGRADSRCAALDAALMPTVPQTAAEKAERAIPSLHEFFAPGGVLASAHPAYEFRRGQLQMAEAVEQALTERRHLIVEAGTGTGKTLAYLLP